MAVYTQVSAEALGSFLARYNHGELLSAKGIAEGVQNSNYLVETTAGRYILTLYEERTSTEDLPFFLDMLDHLASDGNPVPRALPDREGVAIQQLAGRSACLIEFLTGVSVSHPTAAQAYAAGAAMGHMHTSLAGFTQTRANPLGADTWGPFLARCGRDIDSIAPGLFDRTEAALKSVLAQWPRDLPMAAIHSDLFPDNVLMLGDRVTGVIDFYFACTDIRAYDLAVMHTSWAFDGNGENYDAAIGKALIDGYAGQFALSDAERAALPILAQGACLRFLLTRAWDWLNTPADALVTRKDPLAYWRRLETYFKDDLFA
jgi:homoserine kinase type II